MEKLAIKVLTIELVRIGILKYVDDVEELMVREIPTAFYFHGTVYIKIKLDRRLYHFFLCHT